MLAPLAREAPNLTDLVCWAALERGDIADFHRTADAGTALRDFSNSANLLP